MALETSERLPVAFPHPQVLELHLQDELGAGNAASIDGFVRRMLANCHSLLVHLGELRFIDGAGIHLLHSWERTVKERGGELHMVVGGCPITRHLQIGRMEFPFPTHPTVEAGVNALATLHP